MENIEGLSNEELKELILEHLREDGVDPETIEVEVQDGPRVILKGKVDSGTQHEMIKQIITDIVGVEDIIDEIMVIQGVDDDEILEEDEEEEEKDVYDEDEEDTGTEDAFRAVEDGIPYIPPTNPSFQELPEKPRRRRKTKKKGKS